MFLCLNGQKTSLNKLIMQCKQQAPRAYCPNKYTVVIGHEIIHGFDDKGRQFDHAGNINQWWDHESSERFHNKVE